jgi:uncharacterized membrane protein YfhO
LNLFYSHQASLVKLAIPHLYPLVIGSFLWIPFIFVKFEGKKYFVIFVSILGILTLMPAFYIIVNGIMDVRWVFMIVFVNALMAAYTLEYRATISIKKWIISAALWLALLISLYIISRLRDTIFDAYYTILHLHIVVSIMLVLAYTWLFIKENKLFKVLFILLLIFEGSYVLYNRMFFKGSANYITQEANIDFEDILLNEQILSLKESDQSFYRIDVEDVISTQAAAQDFAGFSMYMSTYSFDIQSFYTNRLTPMRKMEYSDSKDLLKTILGTKYYQGSLQNLPLEYSLIGDSLYQNNVNVGLGFATSVSLNKEEWLTLPIFEQDLALYEGIVVDHGDHSIPTTLLPILEKGVNAGIDVSDIEADYFIVDFSQSNPNGLCQVDYSKDGIIIQSLIKDDYGYAKFPKNPEAKFMYFYCSSVYNPNEFLEVNVYPITETLVENLNQKVSIYDHFENVKIDGSKISAQIEISTNESLVYTTVPYDLGWQVKVDEKKIKMIEVNSGFVGFVLNQGLHHIQMTYTPKGFILGLVISSVSVLFFILQIIRKRGAR